MKLPFYLLTLAIGITLTVHLAMNSKVGVALQNPRLGNAFFWCVGALTAIAIGLPDFRLKALSVLRHVNPLLFSAGALGACLVLGLLS